ncbi:hypothetical protein AVEN_35401-1 [Araneus ventricosus]|uniref:Uncharacterized protein n=1 Tax=Araneus ventricosus TaxID=182803 RepID=A0A4Y2U8G6_ARAVE|nr:hypothetical protein AVEN_35401-1 [Araneus ventricosus]
MTRTTPGLAAPSPSFRTSPMGGCLDTTCDLARNRPNASSVESGFEPGILRPQSQDLTTRPPRPLKLDWERIDIIYTGFPIISLTPPLTSER